MIEKDNPQTYIFSVGGSLITTKEGIDTEYLKKFNVFIREKTAAGMKFFLVCGGGNTARLYQNAAQIAAGDLSNEELDWLGIYSTHLNAHLVRTLFRDLAHKDIIVDYAQLDKDVISSPVVVSAGWEPGYSTDFGAVHLASVYNVKTIVNISNIDMIYDKDPHQHSDAKPIKTMTWDRLLSIIGTEWTPGAHAPFDPIAAQKAKRLDLKVIVCNGKDLNNLANILHGKDFTGTVIE